jgi:prepilin-type N-terminal cleavage/methylation domain-containing protein
MSALSYKRRGNGGFSLVELLVTVVLAGIIFLAMVPLFVSVLKKSSTDTRRVVATNLAQARVDKVKMLAFADITPANLNSATFAAGQFNTSFTPAKGGLPYTITTTVTTPTPTAAPPYKTIAVTVSRSGDAYSTKVTTNIMNPIQITSTSTSGTGDPTGPFSITAAFKSSAEVSSAGVVIIRYTMNSATPTPSPTATLTISPTMKPSTSPITSTVVWPSLAGGMGYEYSVTCNTTGSGTETSPLFHLLSNAWLKFDTNPGGS